MPNISPADRATYHATNQRRLAGREVRTIQHQQNAWQVAHQASALLKQTFATTKVMVFGSLVNGKRFHLRSDLDLAVWGLDERVYYRALAQLLNLDMTVSVDLVQFEYAEPYLQAAILREGKEL